MTSPRVAGPGPGRRSVRSTRRGPTPSVLLAIAVPALCVVAALVVRPVPTDAEPRPPTRAPLRVASLACPGSDAPSTTVSASSLADVPDGRVIEGGVTVGIGDQQPLDVRPGTIATATTTGGATVLSGTGDLAAALVATRVATDPLAAIACRPATTDQWFTGVGAAAEHRSVLELVNPDTGPAVADVTIYASTGPVDAPSLRGVAVAAGQSTRFDLSQVVPRRGDLTVRVQTTRGRLGVAVADLVEDLGDGALTSDWLPSQSAPARENTLIGLTRGTGPRRLSIGNPGTGEVQVDVEVITPRTTFAPEGLGPFRVPPESGVSVSIDALLEEATGRGALGLRITASAPVTAGLRQSTPDLSAIAPLEAITTPTALVLPGGRARLQMAAPDTGAGTGTAGTVTVTAADAAGTVLASRQVELVPGTADSAALPRGTALVTVDPGGIAVRGAVVLLDPGATVLGLTPLARTSDVPDVRPGLP